MNELTEAKEALKQRALDIVEAAKKEMRELSEQDKEKIAQLEEEIEQKNQEIKELQSKEEVEEAEEEKEEIKDEGEEPKNEENKEKKSLKKMNKKEERFSLVKAIRAIANNQPLSDVELAVINKGQEEARNAGISTQGQIQLPTVEERAAITVTAEGEDVVATDLFDILKPLRARNVLAQAGAKFMGGLVGNVQIPTMTAENVGWAGEVATASDGAGSFGHKTLTPKRLTAYIDVSKQLLAQDSSDIEAAIREDLIAAINGKLESQILSADDGKVGGASIVAPIGMRNGVTAETITSFADICEAESDIEDANVINECKYIMSNKAKAALRSMAKSANNSGLVYENGAVDGTPALNTSHLGTDLVYIYGDWSNLAVGAWGGVDLVVDPYTRAANGEVRIVVNAYFDAVKLRDNAFVVGLIDLD